VISSYPKNIKFNLQLDFHMKNILSGRINHLKFKDEETVRSTHIICATHSTIASLSLYIYIHMIMSFISLGEDIISDS
jgi:hypothetical protein